MSLYLHKENNIIYCNLYVMVYINKSYIFVFLGCCYLHFSHNARSPEKDKLIRQAKEKLFQVWLFVDNSFIPTIYNEEYNILRHFLGSNITKLTFM
eukprot:UN19187